MSWSEGQQAMYDEPPKPEGLTEEQEELFDRLFRQMVAVIEEAERERSEASLTPEEQTRPELLSQQPVYHASADLATLERLPEHWVEPSSMN